MSKPLLWTTIASLSVAAVSLAISGWVIANDHPPFLDNPSFGSVEKPVIERDSNSTTPATVSAPSNAVEVIDTKAVEARKVEQDSSVSTSLDSQEPKVFALAKHLEVARLVPTNTIRNREPVSVEDSFRAGTLPVYAFVELKNQSDQPAKILIVFEKGSTRAGLIELRVPAHTKSWRTWGYTRALREAGQWDVVVREAVSGKELARTTIEVRSSSIDGGTGTRPMEDFLQPETML